MIALRDGIPLIVHRNRRAVAFDRDWLARVLSVAAQRAGQPDWPLARHVAESVHAWLATLQDRATMSAESLTKAIREALKSLGFAEIAARFEASAPFSRISVVEIAREAGNGFELAFFAALRERLREVFTGGGTYCELHHITPGVKLLRQCQHWSGACDALRSEIVAFARDESMKVVGRTNSKRELFLHVA